MIRGLVQVSGSATKRGSGEEDMNEEEPRGRVGISIQNLLKVFDDVSFTWIYICSSKTTLRHTLPIYTAPDHCHISSGQVFQWG